MKDCLLIVDDDEKIRHLLSMLLASHSFDVHVASSPKEALELLTQHVIDLMILDVMMPGENGFDFLKRIRGSHDLPVIFLSARGDVHDRIEGFSCGGDDFLPKPFDPTELLMRIQARLKRVRLDQSPHKDEVALGDFVFKKNEKILEKNGKRVPLSSTQEELLAIFVQHPYRELTRDYLCKKAHYGISTRSVDVQITRLRKIIDKEILRTVRHVGYMLCPTKNPR